MREGGCGREGKGRRGDGEGEVEKGGGCCVLTVAREQKRTATKSIAAARFPVTRYC